MHHLPLLSPCASVNIRFPANSTCLSMLKCSFSLLRHWQRNGFNHSLLSWKEPVRFTTQHVGLVLTKSAYNNGPEILISDAATFTIGSAGNIGTLLRFFECLCSTFSCWKKTNPLKQDEGKWVITKAFSKRCHIRNTTLWWSKLWSLVVYSIVHQKFIFSICTQWTSPHEKNILFI